MWWESKADASGEESLIQKLSTSVYVDRVYNLSRQFFNVVRAMGGSSGGKMEYRENWLCYPDS